ncbi:MAG: helix-turn-helix transcriptional regulator [Wenzhouxiangella sp.]
MNQTELGELLGVSQQTINSFEKGRRRVPASALPSADPSPSSNSNSNSLAGYRGPSNGLSAR